MTTDDTNDTRVRIPDVVARFATYYQKNPAWGSLHVVLDDGNTDCVLHCQEWAEEHGDDEGAALAEILGRMTKSQRGRLPRKVCEYVRKKQEQEQKREATP